MFCVECGREGPTIDGLCAKDFRKRHPIVRPPEAIDANVCADCGRIEMGKGWARVDLEIAIPSLLRERIPVDPRASRVTFTHTSRAENPRNLDVAAKVAAQIEGLDLVESFRVRLRLKAGLCPTCTRRHSQHYEGSLQHRTRPKHLGSEDRDRRVGLLEAAVEPRSPLGEAGVLPHIQA